MKILHILKTPRAEGTVKLVLDWLGEASPHQEVFVLDSEPPELRASLRESARWYGEAGRLPPGVLKIFWIIEKVRQACAQRRPDLVICWVNGFSPWVLIGARLGGVKRLITHAGNPPSWNWWGKTQTVVSTFVTWLVGGHMVCCSHYVASEYRRSPGVSKPVLRVVHNCSKVVEVREAASVARRQRCDARPRLIMVATLESHKDHVTLLNAMPIVLRHVPEVQLWLAGEGTLRGKLTAMSTALGLNNVVEFLGSRRDVPALLGQSDLFVFSTTHEEGLGTVLFEALAAGLPVVASDVPACREALADGRWGELVEPASPDALASRIVAVLAKRVPVDIEARDLYLNRFTPASMIAAYLAVSRS